VSAYKRTRQGLERLSDEDRRILSELRKVKMQIYTKKTLRILPRPVINHSIKAPWED
jgi:hypothetical protein